MYRKNNLSMSDKTGSNFQRAARIAGIELNRGKTV